MSQEILSKIKDNKSLEGLSVLIWGMGVTGRALYKVCEDYGASVWNTDKEYLGFDKFIVQNEVIESNIKFDLILKSPGVPWLPELNFFKSSGVPVLGELEIVSLLSDTPIIAITGSNGKTTVCTMLKEAFDLLGINTFLGGNIGNPYSKILGNNFDYALLEVSSFQLELINEFSPLVASILNIVNHHQERHPTFEHYQNAKFNIFKNMNEFSHLIIPDELKKQVKGDFKVSAPKGIRNYSKMKVVGEHNQKNFQFVEEILNVLGMNTKVIDKLISSFKGVEHRIEFVGNFKGLKVYNDSKSTNFNSTLTAIKSFKNKEELVLFLGGQLRSNNVEEFLEIKKYLKDDQVYLFGQSRELLSRFFKSSKKEFLEEFFREQRFQDAILLFSPGFPSYDQFKNFKDRGENFKKIIQDNYKESIVL